VIQDLNAAVALRCRKQPKAARHTVNVVTAKLMYVFQ